MKLLALPQRNPLDGITLQAWCNSSVPFAWRCSAAPPRSAAAVRIRRRIVTPLEPGRASFTTLCYDLSAAAVQVATDFAAGFK